MSFKVAVVQPMAHKPPDDKKNIACHDPDMDGNNTIIY